jgi:phosphoglycolate phosphatase-like HAD superfamily hydrolase
MRSGSALLFDLDGTLVDVATRLSEEDIEAVAAYIQALH